MSEPPFVSLAQVAALTGFDSPRAFQRQRRRLEDDHAFPMPLPTRLRNPIWRRDAVEDWLAEQGRAKELPRPERPSGPNVYLMELARTA